MSDENERSFASAGYVADDSDLVDRLSDLSGDVGRWGGKTIGEAIAEIARLRLAIRRLAEQDATLSVVGGNVIVTMDATLTDAEREAVAWAERFAHSQRDSRDNAVDYAATLRGLLDRTAQNKTDGYVE